MELLLALSERHQLLLFNCSLTAQQCDRSEQMSEMLLLLLLVAEYFNSMLCSRRLATLPLGQLRHFLPPCISTFLLLFANATASSMTVKLAVILWWWMLRRV